MKKKLLLIALPALMVLSGCSNALVEQPALNNDAIVLEEDTLAHEEIFGGQAIKGPAIRKMSDVGVDTDYKVGYQIHFDDKGTVDGSDDMISIRFIAAIKADYTVKRWTRAVSSVAGEEIKALSDHRRVAEEDVYFDSSVVYTHLANGEGNDEMDATQGAYADYTGFIVYSLLNIPYEANKNAYVGVTLALDAVKTEFYAVKIEKNGAGTASAHHFKFVSNKDGFFLAKGESVVDAEGSTRDGVNNAASFSANLAANDTFVVAQKTASSFKIWDGSCLQDANANVVNDNGLVKVNTASRYVFFLNKLNKIYFTKFDEPTSYYVRGTAAQGWADEDCVAAYQFITDPDNMAVIFGVSLTVGDFKISDIGWNHYLGFKECKDGHDPWKPNGETGIVIGGAAGNFEAAASDDNIHCKVAGTYNIYLTNNWYVSFELAA